MTVPPDVFHKNLPIANRHAVHNLTYADATNRIAGTNEGSGIVLDATNLYQFAKQDDNDTLWMLTGYSPITWDPIGSGDLDDIYHNGTPSTDHVVDVDQGKVIWRVSDTYGFRVETEAAGADVGFTDDDCEEVDMSSWTIESGSASKDTSDQHSGSRCIDLDGGTVISQATVFTIGTEQTFGIWVMVPSVGPTPSLLRVINGTTTIANLPVPKDDTYHRHLVTFTPTSEILKIQAVYA